MEDDNSAKAPVTRLRRRLSVESAEEKSSTPNTPSKKRGRAPKLDQIDENVVTPQKATPKRVTRRTAKDTLEPVEEKPLTPVRRSTRIKSNTSIVSDTAVNTAGDTPRAKRVTRRNSQLGSDSETPLTPAKQTRRTKKDSTPKLDKDETDKNIAQITEIIAEEPEFDKGLSTPSHSPLNNKKELSGVVIEETEKKADISSNEDSNKKNRSLVTNTLSPDIQKENISPGPKQNKKGNLSASTIDLLNNVEKCTKTEVLNKTTSHIESKMKPYKKRTKSWSTISSKESLGSPKNEAQEISFNKSEIKSDSEVGSLSPTKHKNQNLKTVKVVIDKMDLEQIPKESSTENKNWSSEELFNKDPSEVSKPEIIMEEMTSEKNILKTQITQDQFVPVVDVSSTNADGDKIFNDSVEPMDIDQTIPESMGLLEEKESFTKAELNNKSRNSSLSGSKRKSSISQTMESENKSTMILSQLNEHASQTNILGKSQMPSDNTSMSKSLVDMDNSQNIHNEQKNQTITCLTSTPLQQKPLQRLIAPINTSIINSNDNIHNTPKTSIDTNSPLVKISTEKNSELFSPSKNLRFDQDCDENVAKDETKKIDPSITSVNDRKIKSTDDVKNVLMNNSNSLSSKDKEIENDKSSQSNKSKESKLSMEVDSSDEDSSDDIPNLNKSKKSENSVSDASNDSDASHDESKSKNDLINDEADDAGDNYESGDSQDEEELQYAKENEIIDKGVTLTSDEDFSNDSDYEKDSFIVSSDEEDNQLLEGTDDDLSMSDNELKMTAKSKKKYNERMIKEQKKASKEMYESRHKLNIKKKNVIEDESDSESDDDKAPKQQKKSNRMRLDSSHETSVLNESKSRSKNKNRLSESSVNETLNEKEMTQMNVSSQENDPLATSMKKEPKSPKEKEDTTLDFISVQSGLKASINSSQSNNENKSKMDPLEAEKEDDSSSDSDTNNIISNYDSILSTLNKADINKLNTSLNIDVKRKVKGKRASIIDELNLTQSGKEEKGKTPKSNPQKDLIEDDDASSSSDSINLKFLLSEDSNTDSINTKNDDESIPLKPGEAKTDVTNNEEENMECGSEDIFFIDTQGSLEGDKPAEEKIKKDNISTIKTPQSDKKKKEKLNVQTPINDTVIEKNIEKDPNTSSAKTPKSDKKKQKLSKSMTNVNEAPIEQIKDQSTSNVKTPKSDKKKKQKLSDSVADIDDGPIEEEIQRQDTSNIKTPKSERKKKKKSLSQAEIDVELIEENVNNISSVKTPKSDKKKQKLAESQVDDTPQEEIIEDHSSFKSPSEMKEERLSKSLLNIESMQETIVDQNTSKAKTPKSDKKKKQKMLELQADAVEQNMSEVKTPKSGKKQDFSELQGDIQELDSSNAKTPRSAKKKKLSLTESQTNIQVTELNLSNVKTPQSEKKKKRDLSELQANNQELASKVNTPKSDKKKKQNISLKNIEDENIVEEISVIKTTKNAEKISNSQIHINIEESGKKQENDLSKTKGENKNKKQMLQSTDIVDGQSEELVIGKKKRKRTLTVPVEEIIDTVLQSNGNDKKKRKIKHIEETVKATDLKKSKKRKEREDDEHDQPKVHLNSKMSVPRLPMSVITQLEDNPKIQAKKKTKVISTSQFIVEDYRRKMPSKYLEESVYLHDDSPEKKKPKKNMPKVLPSMPSSSSSNHGFTTTFKINVLSAETKFVAQADSAANFKEDRLYNKIQKRRTHDHFKKQRSSKLSKF